MSTEKSVYVVMRRSGHVMQMGGMGGGVTHQGPYLAILGKVTTEMQSAGSTHDAPDKLFLNGKCVIESGLSSIAWKYSEDLRDAQIAANDAAKNLHMPDWLPSDEVKSGYNPPGVAKWKVEKVS